MKLPKEWNIKSVGDLFDVQLGKMLNKKAKELEPQHPYLGNSNVQWGSFDLSNLKYMHFSDKDIQKFSLRSGDVIMCEGGEVGRCAIWNDNEREVYYQKALHRLRSKGKIISEFFQAYMASIAGTKLLDDYTTRTSIAHLTREKLISIPVKLPPLPEQKKISQILSTWDKAIDTSEKLLANSRQQKKALMQQLLTGKKRLRDKNGVRFSGEWKATPISKMGKVFSGGTPDTKVKEFWGGSLMWLTPTDVSALNSKYVDSTKRTISEKALKSSSATLLPKGTLLVCTRATIGVMAISTSEITTNQGFKNIIPGEGFLVEFLYYLLTFNSQELVKKSSGSTFLEISKKDFEKITLKVPSFNEQQKIAVTLSSADREIETLQQKLDCLKQEKKALMQQLLTGKRRVQLESAQ
ncbi:restriction endonuclease subunit S [Microbulbifer sp. ANSA001]|uniref:restriction endonuclease subunit S n=1 Tax=Microbulbifer sp. ANSA001 TaxID=3243358 RepID=UPI00404183C1